MDFALKNLTDKIDSVDVNKKINDIAQTIKDK